MALFLFSSLLFFLGTEPKKVQYAIGFMIIVNVVGVDETDTTNWNSIILGLQHELEAA
jgi:hypothetical protein